MLDVRSFMTVVSGLLSVFFLLCAYFKGGIDNGYMNKPCLDPYDLECPETAPNYKTKKVINFICLSLKGQRICCLLHNCLRATAKF